MIQSEQELFDIFEQLNIAYKNYPHAATHHFDEHRDVRDKISGTHCKSLFLTDKQDFYFVAMRGDERLDLKALRKELNVRRLSFGKEENMAQILGVKAGSCTPYALINDTKHQIKTVFLDSAFLDAEYINFHPLHNEATTQVAWQDFIRWLEHCGHAYQFINIQAAQ